MKTLEMVNLRLHMSRFYQNLSGHYDLAPYHLQHLEIIDAIKARDEIKAEALAINHVVNVRRLFVSQQAEQKEKNVNLASIDMIQPS